VGGVELGQQEDKPQHEDRARKAARASDNKIFDKGKIKLYQIQDTIQKKLSEHCSASYEMGARPGSGYEKGTRPGSHRTVQRQQEGRPDLLPAGLALTKIDEIDPLHEELDEFITRQQLAYLEAMEQHVMDKGFGSFLSGDFEEKMSHYARDSDKESRGVGYAKPQRVAAKVNDVRDQKSTIMIHQAASAGATRGSGNKSPRDIEAALESVGWGTTTSKTNVEDDGAARRVDAYEYVSRQMENKEFTGLGYKATIKDYVSRRFVEDTKTTAPKSEKMIRKKEVRREEREARDESRTEPGDGIYLAISPSQNAASTTTGEARPRPESLYVHEDTFAIVDTGTTVTITNLKDKTMLESFDEKKRVKIAGFNGSTSKSKGSGTIVGYAAAKSGRTVTIRIPDAHQVDGAPHELVSVSNLVKNGYEFHFTVEESYVITPDREKVDLIEKSGLYWLKMKRAVGPAATAGLARVPRSEYVDQNINEFFQDERLAENPDPYKKCQEVGCEQCNVVIRNAGKTVSLRLMHQRLNHLSEDSIIKMSKTGALDVIVTGKKSVCDVCRTAKAHRNSVPKRRELVDDQVKPFQRVWTDLKGKVKKDIWGNQYVITFTCEATRWTWVGFMRRKSEAKDQYQKFLKWVKLEGHKVEQLNSDSGGEYTASENAKVISEFQKVSEEWGVKQNFTCAHTPEQNGVVSP
jgi:hypothetical protein